MVETWGQGGLRHGCEVAYPYCELMLSTPAPTPMSMRPALMALAISTQACRPELHCLFSECTAVLSGNPAASAAALNSVAPPPGGRTEPTAMSSTRAGSSLLRSRRDTKAPWRRSAAAVSLKPPLPPLVWAVRRQAVTTISSGCFFRIASLFGERSASEWLRWSAT